MKQKILFIDRDGTLIKEPPVDFQVDSLEKLEIMPGAIRNLFKLRSFTDYLLVIVSNQDGLGTKSFPESDFLPPHEKFLKIFENEGVLFDDILIDPSLPEENSPNRKPETGLVEKYMKGDYDLANSYVIGDRTTDIELARNMGCKGIFLGEKEKAAGLKKEGLDDYCSCIAASWDEIQHFILSEGRRGSVSRKTRETSIDIELALDGSGKSEIETGLGFFDHMLEQIARHGNVDLKINVEGDLQVDEHHTIEDTALALGEAFDKALGNKRGINRYGFTLPMDDSLARVAIDFGGRPWIVWDCEFKREKVGDMPSEMFFHFFKSFSDAAKCNLNIQAEGSNEHHKIEAIFKAFSKSIKGAVAVDQSNASIPSTKGTL